LLQFQNPVGGLAPLPTPMALAKSFLKYQNRNATYRTSECDEIMFYKDAIRYSAIKQYL